MKWYKKQLNQLKSTKRQEQQTEKNNLDYSFASKKNLAKVKKFRSPVAESKLSRPKTDK